MWNFFFQFLTLFSKCYHNNTSSSKFVVVSADVVFVAVIAEAPATANKAVLVQVFC